MKRGLAVPVLLAALLAAAAWGGWRCWTELRFLETTDNAYVEADLTSVSPKVEGYAAAVEVADNQPVRRGDVLVPVDARARAEGTRAMAAAAEAAAEGARDQTLVLEAQRAGAEAERAVAEAAREL